MKWFRRLFGRKKRTPLPPKPYIDLGNPGKAMTDPKYLGPGDIMKHIDPEKPHWKDPRFETREKIPYFDLFGYNRDWGWTLFKIASLGFIGLFVQEFRIWQGLGEDGVRLTVTSVTPTPEYARDEEATEKELRDAGFAFVGVKRLDNVGAKLDEAQLKK